MRSPKTEAIDNEVESFEKLIQVMRDDPLINKKVIQVLNMESYQRRLILSNWMEQLRIRNASTKLLHALSRLFDDSVAKKVLTLINKHLI